MADKNKKGELALIDWIRRNGPAFRSKVSIAPGDDLAGLSLDGQELLFGCDQVLDGVHFELSECGARAAGRKALARNLSDVAAMAAEPVGAVASVALPNDMPSEEAQEVVRGMWELAQEFDCPVTGGDVGSWAGKLVINVSILARAAGVEPVLRSGAKPGDVIMVTGELGGAILGKHLSFVPLVKEARLLAKSVKVQAMIDVSDGLAVDLRHITEESGCGARIIAEQIPISEAAKELAKKCGRSALAHSLSDGEDYELLFTVAPGDADRAAEVLRAAGMRLSCIGEITQAKVVLVDKDGKEEELLAGGYEHFTG